jgi:Uma2 family endonuclease
MPEVSDAIEEVVNGEIRLEPAPSWQHIEIVGNVSYLIGRQVDRRGVQKATRFNLIIRRQPLTAREPDLAVFQASTIVEQDGRVHSAPQLIVEVLSPANTRREREEKLADYASLGVPEVWEMAPEDRTVEVLYLEDGHYRSQGVLTEGILKPRHFPDVQIDISEVWPD